MRWKHPTTTVNYFGLILSAPLTSYIAVNDDGSLMIHETEPRYTGWSWSCNRKSMPIMGRVDLEGRAPEETCARVSDLPAFGGLE